MQTGVRESGNLSIDIDKLNYGSGFVPKNVSRKLYCAWLIAMHGVSLPGLSTFHSDGAPSKHLFFCSRAIIVMMPWGGTGDIASFGQRVSYFVGHDTGGLSIKRGNDKKRGRRKIAENGEKPNSCILR